VNFRYFPLSLDASLQNSEAFFLYDGQHPITIARQHAFD
jgi:hypothetical protein